VRGRRFPGTRATFVAIGGDQNRPTVAGADEDNERTHVAMLDAAMNKLAHSARDV
jgi:hypothetical protein